MIFYWHVDMLICKWFRYEKVKYYWLHCAFIRFTKFGFSLFAAENSVGMPFRFYVFGHSISLHRNCCAFNSEKRYAERCVFNRCRNS